MKQRKFEKTQIDWLICVEYIENLQDITSCRYIKIGKEIRKRVEEHGAETCKNSYGREIRLFWDVLPTW